MPLVVDILAQGPTKCSVRLKDDLQVDLRVIEPKSWGAALHYFTGSKTHNIRMRERAIKMGMKLNEYGLFDSNDVWVSGTEEEDIFETLGLPFIPPVLREDQGEIEAAVDQRLPNLIQAGDIAGDLHMHTTWTDGSTARKKWSKRRANADSDISPSRTIRNRSEWQAASPMRI
jgi:DNA polymerase (family 10)